MTPNLQIADIPRHGRLFPQPVQHARHFLARGQKVDYRTWHAAMALDPAVDGAAVHAEQAGGGGLGANAEAAEGGLQVGGGHGVRQITALSVIRYNPTSIQFRSCPDFP